MDHRWDARVYREGFHLPWLSRSRLGLLRPRVLAFSISTPLLHLSASVLELRQRHPGFSAQAALDTMATVCTVVDNPVLGDQTDPVADKLQVTGLTIKESVEYVPTIEPLSFANTNTSHFRTRRQCYQVYN